MNDIEQKALALLNEILKERRIGGDCDTIYRATDATDEALCRAFEQHEAFRQEVSDAVELSIDRSGHDGLRAGHINEYLGRFIIPAPKPDPLVKALTEINGEGGFDNFDHYAHNLRAALDALGFEIREKNDG